jgi:hypothetical protein
MATAKTGSFYLTGVVTLAANAANGTRADTTIDLSSYVNVPTGQAIAIDQADFVYQHDATFKGNVGGMMAGDGAIAVQVTDLNPDGDLVRADDASLVASAALNIDAANSIASHSSDMYPDNFGPGSLSESFMVVNDTLYLTAGVDGAAVGTTDVYVTARIRARVVKLSTKDWMAIAIQSTASDN